MMGRKEEEKSGRKVRPEHEKRFIILRYSVEYRVGIAEGGRLERKRKKATPRGWGRRKKTKQRPRPTTGGGKGKDILILHPHATDEIRRG